MASEILILKNNTQKFLDDIKAANAIVVIPRKSKVYLRIRKEDLLQEAEYKTIQYRMRTDIFKDKKPVMVIM